MPTVRDVFAEASKLSADDRKELLGLILNDLIPEPPNTIRTFEQLEQALLDGLNSGPPTPMTKDDWDDIRRDGRARAAALRDRKPNNDA